MPGPGLPAASPRCSRIEARASPPLQRSARTGRQPWPRGQWEAELTRLLLARLEQDEARSTTPHQREDVRARRAIIAGCAPLDDTLETYGVAAPLDGAAILRRLASPTPTIPTTTGEE